MQNIFGIVATAVTIVILIGIIIAIAFAVKAKEAGETKSFVATSDSVGCNGDICYIRRPSQPPVQKYNNLNSWYVYGPQNPPFIGWLRQQMYVNDVDRTNSYAFDLNMQ